MNTDLDSMRFESNAVLGFLCVDALIRILEEYERQQSITYRLSEQIVEQDSLQKVSNLGFIISANRGKHEGINYRVNKAKSTSATSKEASVGDV